MRTKDGELILTMNTPSENDCICCNCYIYVY